MPAGRLAAGARLPAGLGGYHFDQELAYPPLGGAAPVTRAAGLAWTACGLKWSRPATTARAGYIFNSDTRWAYLGDGVIPPDESLARLAGLDLLFLEATVDELMGTFQQPDARQLWPSGSAQERRCVLTHLVPQLLGGRLTADGTPQRAAWAAQHRADRRTRRPAAGTQTTYTANNHG